MPLKINVGLSKKMGLPDYGSVGASCNVEAEVDEDLDDLESFQKRVRRAYVACAQAVNDELSRHQKAPARPPSQDSRKGNGHSNGDGCGNRNNARSDAPASSKQFDYIRRLANLIKGLGSRKLDSLTRRMFDKPLASISTFEASSMIDTLKSVQAGKVDLDNAVNGVAA